MEELLDFFKPDSRLDLKALALQQVLSLTGTEDGRELLLSNTDILKSFMKLMFDSSVPIAKDAAFTLINLTADEAGTNAFLIIAESSALHTDQKSNFNLIDICLRCVMDKDSHLADPCCIILSNMTRPLHLVDRIIVLIEKSNYTWDSIISAFTAKEYNTVGAKLHYLGPMFSNLSQSRVVRRYLMDRERSVIQRLLPFTEYTDSAIRRGGIVGTLKNCCFDVENHDWLLSDDVDILSSLLLPLAGPEEFDDEDNDKLPFSLQYLPETKMREPDPDIRIMLLEALAQLCAIKECRQILREKNTYVILRELHKWEKDKSALLACEKVVDILIRTEEEIGLNNLKEVDVPDEYKEKFNQMDEDFIKDEL